MRKQTRTGAPEFLQKNWEKWGAEWEANLKSESPSKWNWRQIDGEKVNHKLMPLLKAQAGEHCSFCDGFPVSPPSNETIEHFRPKSRFPQVAWQWTNLFYCCDFCQTAKRSEWKPTLLAPDADDYSFSRYFFPDHTNGRIEVRPDLSPEDYQRAADTLEIYGLNHPRHQPLRLRQLEFRSALPDWEIDLFAYRDFLMS